MVLIKDEPLCPSGGQIPQSVRDEVAERDGVNCRMCGRSTEGLWGGKHLHHIMYGGSEVGIGGARLHDVANLISLCARCHADAHSSKEKWLPVLTAIVSNPGVTGFQYLRWKRAQKA